MQIRELKDDNLHLLNFKNLISRQLPKMTKCYIVRIVFDNRHTSLVLFNENKLIGGVCFRLFNTFDTFCQLVFLVIDSQYQSKGNGAYLMSFLKTYLQQRSVASIVTYADNTAVNYFRKQGFTTKLKHKYGNAIKQYQFGTLMECIIHPTLDYYNLKKIIQKQKQYVINTAKKLLLNDLKYNCSQIPMVPFVKNKIQYTVNPECLPGVIQSGWQWEDQTEQRVKWKFLMQVQEIISLLQNHRSGWIFVDEYSIDNIRKMCNRGQLENNQKNLYRAVKQIVQKCKSINGVDSKQYKEALQIWKFIKPKLLVLIDQENGQRSRSKNKL